eukprot:EG_transcript_5234
MPPKRKKVLPAKRPLPPVAEEPSASPAEGNEPLEDEVWALPFDPLVVSTLQATHDSSLGLLEEVFARRRRRQEERRREEAFLRAAQARRETAEEGTDDPGTAAGEAGEGGGEAEAEGDLQRTVDGLLGREDPETDVIAGCVCRFIAPGPGDKPHIAPAAPPFLGSLRDGTLLDEWLTGPGLTEAAVWQLWERMASDSDPAIPQRCSSTLLGLHRATLCASVNTLQGGEAEAPALFRFEWLRRVAVQAFGVPAGCLSPTAAPAPATTSPSTGIGEGPPLPANNVRWVADTLAALLDVAAPQLVGPPLVHLPELTDDELVTVAALLSGLLVDDRLRSGGTAGAALAVRAVARCLAVALRGLQRRQCAGFLHPPLRCETVEEQVEAAFGSPSKPSRIDLPPMTDYPLVWAYVHRLVAICPYLQASISAGEGSRAAPPEAGDVSATPLSRDTLGGKPSSALLVLCQVVRRLTAPEPALHYAQWALASAVLQRLLDPLAGAAGQRRRPSPQLVPAALAALLGRLEEHRALRQADGVTDKMLATTRADLLDGVRVALTLILFAVPYEGYCPTQTQQAIRRQTSQLARHVEPYFDLRCKRLVPLLELIPEMIVRRCDPSAEAPPRKLRQAKLTFGSPM